MTQPWRLDELTPTMARQRLAASGRLIVPAGTLESRGDHLPIGTDTFILDRLADDLSARTGVVRSPAIPVGARGGSRRGAAGTAAMSRKALHRMINELIAAWEEDGGVKEVVLLTAHAAEAHIEALGAVRTSGSVWLVDVFGLDFGDLLSGGAELHGGELDTSLMLYLHPELVQGSPQELAVLGATGARGERLYKFMLDKVTDRFLPTPSGEHWGLVTSSFP